MRKRITIKSGLVASSDFTRVKSHRASLGLNHKEFISSSYCMSLNKKPITRTEPSDDTVVRCSVFGKMVSMPYYRVKEAGFTNWIY